MSERDTGLLKGTDKKKLVALVVLLGVLAVFTARVVLKRPTRAAAAPSAQPTESTDHPANMGGVAPAQQPSVHVKWPAVLSRDPFTFDSGSYVGKPPKEPVAIIEDEPDPDQSDDQVEQSARKNLVLQGTILGDDPRALVNGRIYTLGKKVDGYVIKKIEHRRIVIEMKGTEMVLQMQ